MNRFWVFPLVLGVVGAALPFLMLVESAAPEWYRASTAPVTGTFPRTTLQLWALYRPSLQLLWQWSAILGTVLGVALATGDWALHRRRDRSGGKTSTRLIGNVIWCGLYALSVLVINDLLLITVLKTMGVPVTLSPAQETLFIAFPAVVTVGVNLAAVLWAAIRTTRADDVLSPRVLRDKLRRSTQLTG